MSERLAINLQKTAQWGSKSLTIANAAAIGAGIFLSPWFHIGTALLTPLTLLNFYYKHIQTKHTLLRNFGLLGTARYTMESVGPELRQYFFMNDNEERPFNRTQRSEVYRKAKDIDSAQSFGSLLNFDQNEVKLKHSMFPAREMEKKFALTFGEENDCRKKYTVTKPMIISAMSFGSLGSKAISALSHGAKQAGIPLNTGEGGLSPYHLEGGADIIFQMGTAKFGVRNEDSSLNEEKLKKIAENEQVKMIEIKFSQGAKPGKGGLLPKEKVTEEIAAIRHVPLGEDVVSPPYHVECDNPRNTIRFIQRVQKIAQKPVGIKLCLGDEEEFHLLVQEMKKQKVFPDYIAIDGSEGGTGAAPKSFMDDVGLPLFDALDIVQNILVKENARNKVKLLAAGKLINAGMIIRAMAHGADACYTARGFMMALGCIQAMQCHKGTCPTGITTHDPILQRGLIIEDKAKRVANYVKNTEKDFYELLTAMGCSEVKDLTRSRIYEKKKVVSA